MMFDALLCFRFPRLARWTVSVVDRFDGAEYPIASVRFRWRRNAAVWVEQTTNTYINRNMTVCFRITEIP